MSPPPGRRPRADTHTCVLYTRHIRVADEVLHARGDIRHHAALLALAALPPVLADAAAAAVLAPAGLPPVLAELLPPQSVAFAVVIDG